MLKMLLRTEPGASLLSGSPRDVSANCSSSPSARMPKFVSVRMNRKSETASHPVGVASSPADLGPLASWSAMPRLAAV
jgi:hypothetical protein